jgi:signal transduction histidine kinase
MVTIRPREGLFLALLAVLSIVAVYMEWRDHSLWSPGFLTGGVALAASGFHFFRRGGSGAARRDQVVSLIGFVLSTHLVVYSSGKGDSALYSFYFVPILTSAWLFGARGSLIVGATVTVLYASFFIPTTMEEVVAELLEEMITLLFISLLSGYLVDRLTLEQTRRLAAERREREQERLAEIGLMAAQIAHEFRNPLQVIEGSAETLAEKGWIAESGASLLDDLRNDARRLSTLVQDFLFYGRPVVRIKPGIVLKGVLDQTALRVPRLRVTAEFDPRLTLSADPDSLERVFSNLLTNSAQAGATAVSLTVGRATSTGTLALVLTDNGPGIPANLQATLFQPFHSGRTGGAGLGLAIARRIIELHGGRITAEPPTTSEQGARFLIELPACDDTNAQGRAAA